MKPVFLWLFVNSQRKIISFFFFFFFFFLLLCEIENLISMSSSQIWHDGARADVLWPVPQHHISAGLTLPVRTGGTQPIPVLARYELEKMGHFCQRRWSFRSQFEETFLHSLKKNVAAFQLRMPVCVIHSRSYCMHFRQSTFSQLLGPGEFVRPSDALHERGRWRKCQRRIFSQFKRNGYVLRCQDKFFLSWCTALITKTDNVDAHGPKIQDTIYDFCCNQNQVLFNTNSAKCMANETFSFSSQLWCQTMHSSVLPSDTLVTCTLAHPESQ